jgi:hypothetical protein
MAVKEAGFDVDQIYSGNYTSSEDLHDRLFATVPLARVTLGTNYDRVLASMRNCSGAVVALPASQIVDLGGGCGIVCFNAALERPDCDFYILDRSQKALAVGRNWASELGIANVLFLVNDFATAHPPASLVGKANLILLEYVLDLRGASEDREQIILEMTPPLTVASKVLGPAGIIRIRFGEFSEIGVDALTRAAFRLQLLVTSTCIAEDGCTIEMNSRSILGRNEDREYFSVMDDIASQFRAYD